MRLQSALPLALATSVVAFRQIAMLAGVDAQFDDLPTEDAPPCPYHGLDFGPFEVADPTFLDDPQAFVAHSLPNLITALYVRGAIESTPLTISSKYSGSKVTSYDLVSTYVACVGEAGVPVPCTILASPFKPGTDSKNQECVFPGGPALTECTFGAGFQAVQDVTFVIKNAQEDMNIVLDE